jgi:hypothetical protein
MSGGERWTRTDFPCPIQPIRRRRVLRALPARIWTDQDWARIQRGYGASDMDQKWDAFAEDHRVFLVRSWTGSTVFEAVFGPAAEGGWRITEAVTDRGGLWRRRKEDERQCVLLELVLAAIVLGEPAPELEARLVGLVGGRSGRDVSGALVLHHLVGRRADPPATPSE